MKKAVRALTILVLIITIVSTNTLYCFAHPYAFQHNKELEAVLFEEGYSKYQSDTIRNYVTALEYASYLAIDQFGGSGEYQFSFLKTMKMGGLPLRFSTIDYSEDLMGSGKQINANTHRLYTHQGWDREYENASVRKFWDARRNILLGTINTVLGFSRLPGLFGYSDKCNSLAGIIYYVHILGDYIEADTYKKVSILQDLAGHEKTDGNDMISYLSQYVEILFEDQRDSVAYKELVDGLEAIAKDAGTLVNSFGGVNTEEEFEQYHQCAIDLLELLKAQIPTLLKGEDHFRSVFYPNI